MATPRHPLAWRLTIVVALVAGAAVLATVGVRGWLREHRERPGEVTVAGCVFLTYERHGTVYECRGEFTSDDGELRVPVVTFPHTGRLADGTRVRATVAGAADTTASTATESRSRTFVTGTGAVLLLVGAVMLARPRRRAKPTPATREAPGTAAD